MAKKTPNKNGSLVGIAAIILATQKGEDIYASVDETKALEAEGLVEVHPTTVGPNGERLVRATAKAIQAQNAQPNATAAGASTAGAGTPVKPSFTIDKGIPIPESVGRGRIGATKYPFDAMEVGDSFFIAEDHKKLASTVSSANQRYAKPDPTGEQRKARNGQMVPKTVLTRRYVVKQVEGGSRIWRKE